ncbi:hypothetical protein QL285_014547 [Trifolium repens]|nr:hypothetical protein QL285_014547 [Trifolium repens]
MRQGSWWWWSFLHRAPSLAGSRREGVGCSLCMVVARRDREERSRALWSRLLRRRCLRTRLLRCLPHRKPLLHRDHPWGEEWRSRGEEEEKKKRSEAERRNGRRGKGDGEERGREEKTRFILSARV